MVGGWKRKYYDNFDAYVNAAMFDEEWQMRSIGNIAVGVWFIVEGLIFISTAVTFPVGVGVVASPVAGVAVAIVASPAYAVWGYLEFKHGLELIVGTGCD